MTPTLGAQSRKPGATRLGAAARLLLSAGSRFSAALCVVVVACGGAVPDTHYYQLAFLRPAAAPSVTGPALAIEPFAADAAYAGDRIVYRKSPFRFDYYHYHRWSAPPALLLTDYLRQGYARTGLFREVALEPASDPSAVVLSGRVLALEEVDHSDTQWLGRVTLELTLRASEDGAVLWSATLSEEEPITERNPEGLARALSAALDRLVRATAAPIGQAAATRAPSAPSAAAAALESDIP